MSLFFCVSISLAQQWFVIDIDFNSPILKLLLYASSNGNPEVLTYPANTDTDGYFTMQTIWDVQLFCNVVQCGAVLSFP